MDSSVPSEDAWTRARDHYIEDLTEGEKQIYYKASPETLLYDASASEKLHAASSNTRNVMQRLQPFVDAIDQYGQALDVYSNAYPLVLSPLWGSIRVVLHLAREFGKYFDKLVDMFSRIGDVLPRFRVYERLFPAHGRLVQALSVAYVDIIKFCSSAKDVFRRAQRSSKTTFKIAIKLLWKPFEAQFGQQLDSFRIHEKTVEKEAGLSHMIEAADARALMLANQKQVDKHRRENEHLQILAMLSATDYEAKYRRLKDLRHEGTGHWLLQNEEYLKWKSAQGTSTLCCHGIPGSGKSVLTSRVIDDVTNSPHNSIWMTVYYHFDYLDRRTLETECALGTLIKQLLVQSQISEEVERRIIQAHGNGLRRPEKKELVDILCSTMVLHTRIYLILDGLDECDHQTQQDILALLKRCSTLDKSILKTFISCREEDRVLRALDQYPHIHLSAAVLNNDIRSFVTGSVRGKIESGGLVLRNPALEQEIVTELATKAQGMFLWVFFQLDDICEAPSDAAIRETLQNLPLGLAETYERILGKISKSWIKTKFARKIFKWIICAKRPLHIEELKEAVAFELGDKSWDLDKVPDEDIMMGSCKGLVIRDQDHGLVRFSHNTVQQYLLLETTVLNAEQTSTAPTEFRLSIVEANVFAGQFCAMYLSFSDFETQITVSPPELKIKPTGVLQSGGPIRVPAALGIGSSLLELPYRLLRKTSGRPMPEIDYAKYLKPRVKAEQTVAPGLSNKFKMLQYVIDYWEAHSRDFSVEDSVAGQTNRESKLMQLALHKQLAFEFRPWGPNTHFGRPYGCRSCSDLERAKDLPYMSLFHYAAEVGHLALMIPLVEEYCSHERFHDEKLLIACGHGHTGIVKFLLQSHTFDISDGRAVNVAASSGHTSTLDHLLSRGGYLVEDNGYVPLQLAAKNGHQDAVRILCERGAHFNTEDNMTGMVALQLATMNGHDDVVLTLLRQGAWRDHWVGAICGNESLEYFGMTALHFAASKGHEALVKILLRFWAQSSGFAPNRGRMPLDVRLSRDANGEYKIVIFKLNIPSVLNDFSEFNSAFFLAAEGGHVNIMAMLQVSTEINLKASENRYSQTTFHLAAANGHVAAIQWLAQKGANIEARDYNDLTALHYAATGGHEPAVRTLLELESLKHNYKASGLHKTPLELAAEKGHTSVILALFELRPWTHTQKYARGALWLAEYREQAEAVQLL